MGSITFSQVSGSTRTPGTFAEFDAAAALAGDLSQLPDRILVFGQMITSGDNAGTAEPLVPTLISSGPQAEGLFGRPSMLAQMLDASLAANPETETWAVGLADPEGGTAATGTIVVAGPATSDGTIMLYIAGNLVQVGITSGQTADEIATAIAAAINDVTNLPVTASVTTDTVTLTCVWAGVTGNYVDLRQDYNVGDAAGEPDGVSLTITAMAEGAGVPDLASMIAVLGDTQYTVWEDPYTDSDSLTAINTELQRRWGAMVALEGLAFAAASGTESALVTLGSDENSNQISIMGSGSSPTPPWIVAAIVGAVVATQDDPALPFQTLALPGMLPPDRGDEFTRDERDVLLHSGIATYTVSGGSCFIERLITTYQTNAQDVPDTTYLDVTTMRTLNALRFTLIAAVATQFPRCKLADDGTLSSPGSNIVTPSSIKAFLIQLFGAWLQAGYVQNLAAFKAGLTVQRNGSNPNRLDALVDPDLMNQFLILAAQIQFGLTGN